MLPVWSTTENRSCVAQLQRTDVVDLFSNCHWAGQFQAIHSPEQVVNKTNKQVCFIYLDGLLGARRAATIFALILAHSEKCDNAIFTAGNSVSVT
jgi:hypothetical protein